MTNFTKKQRDFLIAAKEWGKNNDRSHTGTLDKHDLKAIADSAGLKFPHWITRVDTYKLGTRIVRQTYALPQLSDDDKETE